MWSVLKLGGGRVWEIADSGATLGCGRAAARSHGVCQTAQVLRLGTKAQAVDGRGNGQHAGPTGQWLLVLAAFMELVAPHRRRRTRVSDRVGRAAGQDAHPVEGRHGGRLGGIQPGMVGVGVIQVAPQMRILVAIESVDLRKGIDGLARLCQEKLQADPFSGGLFVFRSRRGTSIRILVYDGQGFWMAQKRLSKGRFVWWPTGKEATRSLQAHQAQLLMAAGDPETAAAPVWRKVS